MSIAHNAHLIGGFLALLCLIGAFRSGRRRWLVENLPTSKTTGVFVGLVELKGTAESEGPPLCSHLTNQACFHYKWWVEEKWACIKLEEGRIKRESGWQKVAGGERMIPFRLKDDCGDILVHPQGAKIEPVVMLDRICKGDDPLYYGKGPAQAVSHSKHQRRFYEIGIPLHQELYVMGKARERKDIIAPEIAEDTQSPMFLISAWTEDEVRKRYQGSLMKWVFGGTALLTGGLLVRDMQALQVMNESWPIYGVAVAGFLFAAVLTWVWMVYNALVDLRNRVRRAWAEVDVQLKRRHELIPRLVHAIKGYREQEQAAQTALAEMRSQLTATPPGVAGPDNHALRNTILAVAECYPELKADENFAALGENLGNTENRIALARVYFNEIATQYNTRLEIVPERFVGRLGGLRPQALMMADGFERPRAVDPGNANSLATVAS